MPFKLPKNGKLSSDIEDRRGPGPPRESFTNLEQDVDKIAAREHAARASASGADYMTEVGKGGLKLQQMRMRADANKEQGYYEDVAKLRASRQKKTSKKFPGVK